MDTWDDTTMEWMAMHNCFNARNHCLSSAYLITLIGHWQEWPGPGEYHRVCRQPQLETPVCQLWPPAPASNAPDAHRTTWIVR